MLTKQNWFDMNAKAQSLAVHECTECFHIEQNASTVPELIYDLR